MKNLTDTFHCSPLSGTLSFNTCLIRRNAKNDRWDGKHKYPFCASCEQGKKIKKKFPDWKHIKTSKKKRPDRIQLRTFKLKKAQVLREEKEASQSETKFSKEMEKPFNAKLFVKAQKRYIETLMKQGKTVEVRERINLVNSELTARGINHDVLQEAECLNKC